MIKIWESRNPDWGRAFTRISDAFKQHAPDNVLYVSSADQADLALVHVVGGGELNIIDSLTIPYILIQHCYFTAKPELYDYSKYWNASHFTVSFHNLPDYTDTPFNFHHMPWGADPEVFTLRSTPKTIKVFGTGHVAETEGLELVYKACEATNSYMYHTGEDFSFGPNYNFLDYMSDPLLVAYLNKSEYVSALRWQEGFELMAIEGLLCGARPLIPTDDTYDWYRKFAITIDKKADPVKQLIKTFTEPFNPLTTEELAEIKETFAWSNIMKEFYKKL